MRVEFIYLPCTDLIKFRDWLADYNSYVVWFGRIYSVRLFGCTALVFRYFTRPE